jgi:hypothetical protein
MNVSLKLYHRAILIGTIIELFYETPWYSGTIVLTPDAEPYKEFFAFMLDEEKQSEEPPFDESIFDDWFIEDEADGERFEAGCPDISDDGEIYWRMWPLGTIEATKNGV